MPGSRGGGARTRPLRVTRWTSRWVFGNRRVRVSINKPVDETSTTSSSWPVRDRTRRSGSWTAGARRAACRRSPGVGLEFVGPLALSWVISLQPCPARRAEHMHGVLRTVASPHVQASRGRRADRGEGQERCVADSDRVLSDVVHGESEVDALETVRIAGPAARSGDRCRVRCRASARRCDCRPCPWKTSRRARRRFEPDCHGCRAFAQPCSARASGARTR